MPSLVFLGTDRRDSAGADVQLLVKSPCSSVSWRLMKAPTIVTGPLVHLTEGLSCKRIRRPWGAASARTGSRGSNTVDRPQKEIGRRRVG